MSACSGDWGVDPSRAEDAATQDETDGSTDVRADGGEVDAGTLADANQLDAHDELDAQTEDAAPATPDAGADAATTPKSACQLSGSCALGEACEAQTECAQGGVCDPQKNVCLADCGPTNIVSRNDLEQNRFCRKITGDLTLSTTFNEIDAAAFPYLEEITGSIVGNTVALTSVTFSQVRKVGQLLLPSGVASSAQLLSMPLLEEAGSPGTTDIHWAFGWALEINMPKLRTLHGTLSTSFALGMTAMRLPSLQTITGNLAIVAPRLTILDLSALRTVTGNVNVMTLLRLPWSSFQGTYEAISASAKSAQDMGCCTPSRFMCMEGANYGC